jgi:hypothetical protein
MAMTIEKPISNWRNFLIWAAVGALFYLAVVLAAAAFRDAGDVSVLVRPEKAAPAGLGLIFTAVVVGLANWNQPASLRNMIKFAIIAAGAAAIAYFGFRMGIRLRDEGGLGEIRASELVAAMIGFLYVLLAIVIGIGLPSPRFGAVFLNVEDAEDLREQRRMLAYATAGLATMGVPLVLLSLAGPGGILPPFVALAIALILFVSATLFAVAQWRHMDELARRLSQECSAMTCYLIMAIGGGWSMLAHLGFAAAPAPLDWLSMFYALVLVAGFIVAGRRGLLKPR